VPVSNALVYWAIDNSNVFSSRNYDLQARVGETWQTVAEVRDSPVSTVSRHGWPVTTSDRFRIRQLRDGGPASRPNIMWVAEMCLY
jgi:hypothetical protein